VLRFDIIAQTANPVTTIPSSFTPKVPLLESNADNTRRFVFSPDTILSGQQGKVDGPFYINNTFFHMDTINVTTYLNKTEIWKLVNKTLVAHPFHIHDIQFFVLDINGNPPPPQYQGLKDVILVQPKDSVRFITKFTDFFDPMVPYMYHCHLLHHEDDGMMGSFLVLDPAVIGVKENKLNNSIVSVFPNPTKDVLHINIKAFDPYAPIDLKIYSVLGKLIYSAKLTSANNIVNASPWQKGIYTVSLTNKEGSVQQKIVVE